MKKLTLAAIGCGNRTQIYLALAARQPERYQIVAAADPDPERVAIVRHLSRNPDFVSFATADDILAQPQLADVMIIGTQDNYHYAPCRQALEQGYDILLEKPIAQTPAQVIDLEQQAARLGRRVLVCHVLRYTPFYRKVKAIVDSGVLGEMVSLNAVEGVGDWHQAHSYVRGKWAISEQATPMIVAKSCHDMDIIAWLFDRPCHSLSSWGGLTYFTAANAPADAPLRCTDGCPHTSTCPYDAALYLTKHRRWLDYIYNNPASTSDEAIRTWLIASPWSRCVYRCDNTAVDHQVVNMQFQGGATATFTMTAFGWGRDIEIFGTRARLWGGASCRSHAGADIIVEEHATGERVSYTIPHEESGHGGGDAGLVDALYTEMTRDDTSALRSSIAVSVASHVMAFAAETARQTGQTVDLTNFYNASANKQK
ncbi:MAG: Gfo/Idh/MocA family oxidoreductase [Anaerolineae bacterium]|nr:Gfo/Idh/MocA family oxidoreductase [Anaerolineae bacterium]